MEDGGQDVHVDFGNDLKDHGLAIALSTSQSNSDGQRDEVEYHQKQG